MIPENLLPGNASGGAPPSLAPTYQALIRFETELFDAVDARLRAEHDLTLGRFETMTVIASHDGACRVQEIAEALAITVGGASKVVDRTEAAGECRRVAHPGDRRSSFIELTPTGRAHLAAASVTFEDELHRRIGAVLTAPELRQFTATLTKLRAAGHALAQTERTA